MPAQQAQTKTGLLAKLGAKLTAAAVENAGNKPDFGNPTVPPGINNGIALLKQLYIGEYKDGKNKGQPFFAGMGVIVEPKVFNYKGAPIPVEGMQVRIMAEALCDTPPPAGQQPREKGRYTFSQHWNHMRNHLLILLGGDDSALAGIDDPNVTPQQREANLLELFRVMCSSGIYFQFRTWAPNKDAVWEDKRKGKWCYSQVDDNGNPRGTVKEYKTREEAERANPYAGREPMTNHQWQGAVPYAPPETNGETSGQDVVDHSAEPSENGDAVEEAPAAPVPVPVQRRAVPPVATVRNPTTTGPVNRVAGKPGSPQLRTQHVEATNANADGLETPEVEAGVATTKTSEMTLEELVEAAGNGDDDAIAELGARADACGIDAEAVKTALSWEDVANLIRENTPADDGSGEAGVQDDMASGESSSPAVTPVKGNIYFYETTVTKEVMDDKTKKKVKKTSTERAECEVTVVDASAQTVTLRNMDDKKLFYKNVPWDQLIEA